MARWTDWGVKNLVSKGWLCPRICGRAGHQNAATSLPGPQRWIKEGPMFTTPDENQGESTVKPITKYW